MSDRAVAVERKVKETRQVERQAALDRFRPTAGLGAEWVWLRASQSLYVLTGHWGRLPQSHSPPSTESSWDNDA
eukprot:495056-Prorocentrum_minimum.AAC.2